MARCGCVSACSCVFDDLVAGDCIDVTVSGSGSAADPYLVTADLVLDTATDECLNCGVNGLALIFDPATDDCLNCGPSGIRLVIDPDTTQNLLSCGVAGLIANFVAVDSGSVDFSGEGTAASPLTAVVAAGLLHTHDGSGGGTSLVIGGVNESGATVPTASSSQSIAMGDFANASIASGPIAIGSGVDATTAPSATGIRAIAIGSNDTAANLGARSSNTRSIAIGGGTSGVPGASASGIDTIAIGASAGTAGAASFTICIGAFSQAHSGAEAIAIGGGVSATTAANATAQGAIAIGGANLTTGSRAAGVTSIAIGGGDGATAGASATGTNSIAVGLTSTSTFTNTVAIGAFAAAGAGNTPNTIAIGSGTDATRAAAASGTAAIAIGSNDTAATNGARSTGAQSIAIGGGTSGIVGASAIGANSIALGAASSASGIRSIAIGEFAVASAGGTETIAIGGGADATRAASSTANGAISIGANDNVATLGPRASGLQSIAIGSGTVAQIGASASGNQAIAIGRTSAASGVGSIALGDNSSSAGTNGLAFGTNANLNQVNAIAIGAFSASITATNTISIGSGTDATRAASATGLSAIAVGSNDTAATAGSRASGAQAVAIGGGTAAQVGASATGAQSIAIGRTSSATATASIAIGSGSTAGNANAVALGDGVSTTNTSQVNIGTKRIFAGAPTTAPAGADLVNSQVSFYQTEADDAIGIFLKESGGGTTNNDIFMGIWSTFAPTWDQGGAVTHTDDYSRYHRVGRHINYEFHLTATGAGTAANVITVSLPFTATGTVGRAVGSAWFEDDTTGIFYAGTAYLNSTTTVAIHLGNGVDTAGLGAAGSAFALAIAAGDTISGAVTFEATT